MTSTDTNQKHVLIFSAQWCMPCKQMASHVWSDSSVKSELSKYTSVQHIDVDDPSSIEMARAYRVAGVPTVVVVDSDGQPLKQANFMSVPQTMEFLK